jgi:hypothetical protein
MESQTISFENTGQVIDPEQESEAPKYHVPTEKQDDLVQFIVDHTDQWREYRNQNFLEDWEKYERIFRSQWSEKERERQSERSKLISPATQQAIETRHAEFMEAVFGQGEYFDIKDDVEDKNGSVDVEQLKKRLYEDFGKDKIRKSIDQIALMGEIYGTGIGEIVVEEKTEYYPMQVPLDQTQSAYGSGERTRVCVKLVPVNPKNFLHDPNGTSIDDCMGVAVERIVGIQKIAQGIESGKYFNVDLASFVSKDEVEINTDNVKYEAHRVPILTYYGLVPGEYLLEEGVETLEGINDSEVEEYSGMVEAIVVITADGTLLKAEKNPYMMQDRPILSYQADTVPNRLLGRGTAEKAMMMQSAVDTSMRLHFDSMALVAAPMIGLDATRIPRGMKFEVKPGKAMMFNGPPGDAMAPMKFGSESGQSMATSKEFERMLLMATATVDSAGTPTQVARDTNMDMATATLIKKYKRVLVNFQEDFLIPFIYKAAYRFMQFAPERYPAVDVKFCPTAALGIIAREYENKQLAFLIQTLGAQNPSTPVLMQGIIKGSGLVNREELLEQLKGMSQPNPQQQQMQQQGVMLDMAQKQAEVQKTQAEAQKATVEAQLAPKIAEAKIISALTNNLDESNEDKSFQKRVEIANLALKEKDINSNENIARMQTMSKMRGAA